MDTNDRRARATHDATQWWNRLSALKPTDVSQADRESFTEWLRESPLHVSEFLRVAHVHDSLEHFKLWSRVEVGAVDEPDNVVQLRDDEPPFEQANNASEVRSRVRTWAIAASACFVAILGAWFAMGLRGDVIESKRAERRRITDGELAARNVSGVFEATDSETLLAFIRQSGNEINITRTDAGIVIGTLAQ